ncbi:MAG: CCA tRNA nucleotidyltransferase [Clostridiales bacterium]|jgi:tRNA nucleotidyltransferase (CCA-adding enzyme)|nr:CCA tRNA nucleotidyltransferase [Clostridiales bacterium]
MRIDIPCGALQLIARLNQAGHEAYAVGGCVRDSLLGKIPPDWDITTPAKPPEIAEIFADFKQIRFGSRHGTIAVKPPGAENYYEITTYRIDGNYADGRRPDSVSFTHNLTEDLRRRDFTINAMAYSPNEGLIDPFGGAVDLAARQIRCVGASEHRFSEDYLRIIRAYRFAAVLGFDLEPNTHKAAKALRHNLAKIARERIGAEISKLLVAENFTAIRIFFDDNADVLFPEIAALRGFAQNNPYHIYDVYDHSLEVLRHTSPALHMRLAAVFHDVGKLHTKTTKPCGTDSFKSHPKYSLQIAKKALRFYCFDSITTAKTLNLIRYHHHTLNPQKVAIKRFICEHSREFATDLLDFQRADNLAKSQKAAENLANIEAAAKVLAEILDTEEPATLKDLALNGQDIMRILKIPPGPAVGGHLKVLLEAVIEDPSLNDAEKLVNLLGLTDSNP